MTLRLTDIADFEMAAEKAGLGRKGGRRAPFSPSRRDFLRGATLAATGLALHALGLLPTARPALANDDPNNGWQIWGVGSSNPCSGLDDWVLDDDCNGCHQKLISSIFCASDGYHKGPAHGCWYKFRTNECKDVGTAGKDPDDYDGWIWTTSLCCSGRKNKRWRCTDGWYRDDCDWSYAESICRVVTNSGDAC